MNRDLVRTTEAEGICDPNRLVRLVKQFCPMQELEDCKQADSPALRYNGGSVSGNLIDYISPKITG